MTMFIPKDQLETMLDLEAAQTFVNFGKDDIAHMARMMALSELKRNSHNPLYIQDMDDCF